MVFKIISVRRTDVNKIFHILTLNGAQAAGTPNHVTNLPGRECVCVCVCEREREIERDFLFFESASGRFEPTTPV